MKKRILSVTSEMKMYKGMTLVEVMIVVSLIVALIVFVTLILKSQIFKSNDARRKADLQRIGIAVEEYEKDNNCYPTLALVKCTNGGAGLQPYLEVIPCDPVSKTSYYYETDGTSCSRWYRIYAELQNENDKDYLANIGLNAAYSYYYASPNAPEVVPQVVQTGFVGCKSGVCVPIAINPQTGLPECQTNYSGTSCYNTCGTPQSPQNECLYIN